MVCGRVCVMVWGICFGVGVLRGVLCGNGNGVWIAAATPFPALPRCGLRPAGEGVVRWKVGCSVVGLGCVFGRCSVGCGVQKRQWCLDCCLYPLPNPPPLRASPCRGGSGSAGNVVRLSVWIVCLVVAPWVVVCRNGNGGWIAASTPSPTLPRCGLRPAGEGVVRLSVRGCGFCPDRPYVCRVTRFALTQPAPLFALAFIHTLERSRCM